MHNRLMLDVPSSPRSVPVVPGYHGEDQTEARLIHEAHGVGFPLLVKAVSGGGGKGMKLAMSAAEVRLDLWLLQFSLSVRGFSLFLASPTTK